MRNSLDIAEVRMRNNLDSAVCWGMLMTLIDLQVVERRPSIMAGWWKVANVYCKQARLGLMKPSSKK